MSTENIVDILSKSIFLIPFKIDSFQGLILLVGWTLNYEVWFYIFMFLSSVIFKSMKILYIFTCYFILTSFFIFIKQEKFIFNFIWLEFIIGIFLCQKFEFINTLFNRHKIFFHFMLLFVLLELAFFEVEIFVSNWRFLFGFIGILIFLVFVNLNVANSITKILGEMSYPIYLFRLPTLYVFYRFNIFLGGRGGASNSIALRYSSPKRD